METVLSRIRVSRAYYHCGTCKAGTVPKDSDLDIVSTPFSPGVRRLMAGSEAKRHSMRALQWGRRAYGKSWTSAVLRRCSPRWLACGLGTTP